MKFEELAYGARFKYSGHEQIWIKIADKYIDENRPLGFVAQYDPNYIKDKNWIGQKVASFADNEEQVENLELILCED